MLQISAKPFDSLFVQQLPIVANACSLIHCHGDLWSCISLQAINSTPGMGAYMHPFQKAYLCRYIWISYTKSHMASDTALENSASELFDPIIKFEQPITSKKVMVYLPRRVSQSFPPHIGCPFREPNPGIFHERTQRGNQLNKLLCVRTQRCC